MQSQFEIFEACKNNSLKRVTELLDLGVDPNLTDFESQSTPMHYAASNGSKHVMELLMERGAQINSQNDRGLTPLHHLIAKRYDNQGVSSDLESSYN
jgi:ankyrin repeat protein